ncbi:MAG: aspartate aminotransferase family protein [Candidatus Hydrothermarchaeales archaeon]
MNFVEADALYLAQTYKRQPIQLVEGHGAIVRDSNGKEYIDCISGIAVLNVGHSHPKVVDAIKRQADRIIHSSNLYYIGPQVELGDLLYKVSGGYKSFFCNSGAEANEAAIKLARKYTKKAEIISAENSFHGRTLATLSATGQRKYRKPFEPLPREFKLVKYGDADAVKSAITDSTAAVLLEPIQGEGGVIVPSMEYLREVREICHERNVLFMLDEVQTAFGRVGEMFAWQLSGAEPDVFTLAKALGGGFPIGAMLARPEVMDAFEPGDHASTFGGNHLACAAAKASIDAIVEEGLLSKSKKLGEYFKEGLNGLKSKHASIKDVRGLGLMLCVELDSSCAKLVDEARERGVLINCIQENVLRFLPPLVIEMEQIKTVLAVLDELLEFESDGE